MKIAIRHGRVVDPRRNLDETLDVLIEDGRLVGLVRPGETEPWAEGGRVIEARGLIVTPGLIDMHVHLREPGAEHKETIATGLAAAAAGGFTAVASMPNTNPVTDQPDVVRFVLEQARRAGTARLLPVAAMTLGSRGTELCDFRALAEAGAAAVSDDGRWVPDSGVMRRVLIEARAFGLTAISHAEDMALAAGGVMNQGATAQRLGLPGIPAEAEEIAVFRDLKLAALTRTGVHLAHISTAGSVDLIREAKTRGVAVTAETAPHYFTLTEQAVADRGPNAKMNPPLRTENDREAIIQGLAEGVLDVVATDHAPHTPADKSPDLRLAAFGVVGLETALPLVLRLVRDGRFALSRAIEALCARPAEILGIEGGTLVPGGPADLTVIDPDHRWEIRADRFRSKSRNTPFEGLKLQGRAVMTLVGGRVLQEIGDGAP